MKKNNILLDKTFFYSLLLMLFFVFSLKSTTKRVNIIPYSSFAVGESQFNTDVVFNSIGKISSCISNELENNQINFSNPAANKYSLYTTFNLSGIFDIYYFKSTKTLFRNINSTFSNISISFPISKKLFFGIGAQPYTQFPYKNLYKEMQYYKKYWFLYYGNSGINSLHTIFSYSITNTFNIGLRINYLFANFEKILDYSNNKKDDCVIRDNRKYVFSTIKITPGFFYSIPMNQNDTYKLNIGGTLSSDCKFLTDINFLRLKYLYLTDNINKKINKSSEIFVLNYIDHNLKAHLPMNYSFGISIQKNKYWLLGVELSNQQFSKFYLPPKNSILYKNKFRCSLGGFILPKIKKNYNNYFKKIVFRFGGYYENTGLVLFNNSIHQIGLTCGLGLPIGEDKNNPSKLNLGFELGKIGKMNSQIHEETFFKMKLGLNLSEIWSNHNNEMNFNE